MALIDGVKQVFSDELGIPGEEVTLELAYGSVPEWDSGSHMVAIMALEEKYGIEFGPDEVVEMTSVAAIVEALKDKGAADA